MGQQQTQSILASHTATKIGHCITLLTPPNSPQPKYIMRSYQVGSQKEILRWRKYLKTHRQGLEGSQELTRMVQVIEEEQGLLCGGGDRLHLVYEYGAQGIDDLIRERRQSGGPHFSYQDICNILYSCLSALWWARQTSVNCPQPQLARHRTIFLSTRHMLLLNKGTLKIMDPLLHHYNERHIRSPTTYYSPEKLLDFTMVDDEKCAIFELGMTLLEISLLESLHDAYYRDTYLSDVAQGKLSQAKQHYSVDSGEGSIFDLIGRMIQEDRESRIGLDEAIVFGEDLYESRQASLRSSQHQSPTREASIKPAKEQEQTRASSAKPTSKGKFHRVRDWMVSERQEQSPSVATFTIDEVSKEREENSSMLGSLTVDHPSYDLTHSSLQTGVFKNVSMGESYQYYSSRTVQEDENLFTSPALLKLINQQLEDIKEKAAERKQRRDSLLSERLPRISNVAYLSE